MPRFSANISIMFPELDFIDRFAAAKRCGFDAVECWFPYDQTPAELQDILDTEGLKLVGINSRSGNAAAGEWGLGAKPGGEAAFDASVAEALDYAVRLRVPAIHVMAGVVHGERAAAMTTYRANLDRALRRAEGSGVVLMIEPLNHRDRPNYLLNRSDEAGAIIAEVGNPQLRMMFDIYHIQISEGDIMTRLGRHFPAIGHIQIASVPARAEPDIGELNYRDILREIDRLGWSGWVGCEYKPVAGTEAGLGWREKM